MNKNTVVNVLILGLTFSLTGCSKKTELQNDNIKEKVSLEQQSENKGANDTKITKNETSLEVKKDPAHQIKQLPGQSIVLMMNGGKFEATKTTLVKGDIVTDLTMFEKARVTGDLVVVTDQDTFDQSVIKDSYTVRNIAKATYQLTPKSSENLLLNYKLLRQLTGVKRVEVQLDYSPIEDGKATY